MATVSRRDFLRAGAVGAGAVGAAALGDVTDMTDDAAAAARRPGLSPGALRQLRRRLTGPLLLPGTAGYATASAPANGRYRFIKPVAVAVCADEQDVVTCVNWSRENGVPPVGRGGGHSYAGYSTTPGLLINLSRLNKVHIETANGTATSGGAALNNDFLLATQDGQFYLPGGTCLGVGIGGLTLGGGIGYNTHWAGLTADHLTASRIVTANGDLRSVDPQHDPDLFWACQGGAGGSFGINTSFDFTLVKVPTDVWWYRYDWRGADAATGVINAFNHLVATAPPAFNAVAAATAVPPKPGESTRHALDVFSRGQYLGTEAELRDLVQPLLAAGGTPTQATFTQMKFWDVIRMISTKEPPSHCFGDISRYAAAPIPERATNQVVDLLAASDIRSADNNPSFWSLGWVGGDVVNSVGRTDTAYVHRGMSTLLRPTTVWADDADPSVGRYLNEWTDAVIEVLNPYTPYESYQNFPNRRITNWQQAYYAENFARLVEVKRTYDPGNLFHNAQSIPTM